MIIEFEPEQQDEIAAALAEHLGITGRKAQNKLIRCLENTGVLACFDNGSMLQYTHLERSEGVLKPELADRFHGIEFEGRTTLAPAFIKGFQNNLVCFDTHEVGTAERPGILMGLVSSHKKDRAAGALFETSLQGIPRSAVVEFVVTYLEELKKRKCPNGSDVYTFDIAEMLDAQGQKLFCLMPVVNPESDLYVFNPHSRFQDIDLSYHNDHGYSIEPDDSKKRAAIIALAAAEGSYDPETGIMVSNMDYLRSIIERSITLGIWVEHCASDLYLQAMLNRSGCIEEAEMEARDFYKDHGRNNRTHLYYRIHTHRVELEKAFEGAAEAPDVESVPSPLAASEAVRAMEGPTNG